jgi:serine/threonine protein kinase
MMNEYNVLNNYVVFEEINSDSIGINYRAGELEERQVSKHVLLTEVYPFISGNPDIWKRVNILMEGIRKSNIPNLYSPGKIIKEEDKALLSYPFMKGRTFEKILEDSTKKDVPLNFDLTFSIGIAIADLIDTGSSIVVSGQKSFHGFLTPDNILIDYEGKIYLKNYGIFPYLTKTEELFNEMVNKYGAWVAPEFLRKERLIPQSDIYHLGYIIYRILTGEYFSYSEGEDFDAKFANIRFTQSLPSSEKDFFTNLITFFKKTLDPDPTKRFANMKEFKDYIAHFFHIEELSSVTFSLAYFMNSLYLETLEEENKRFKEELSYALPEEKEAEPAPADGKLADDILAGLEEKKGSRLKIIIPLIALVVIVAALAVYFITQTQKAAREQQQQQTKNMQEMQQRFAQLKKEQDLEKQKIQEQLKAMEEKTATTEEEKKQQEEELKKIRERQKLLDQKEQERIKAEQEALQKQKDLEEQQKKQQEETDRKRKQEEEAKKKLEEEKKRLEEERNKVTEGQLIPLMEAEEKPVRIKGKDPIFPYHLKNKYSGNKDITIRAILLIDEKGAVTNVRILSKPPEDVTNVIVKTMKKWQYKPATKKNIKVKVWLPVSLKVSF